PDCRGESELDDAPESYFSYVSQARLPKPPPVVDQVLDPGAGGARNRPFHIDKEVAGNLTVLWMQGTLDRASSLKRVADGLEGKVLLVLDRITDCTDEGSRQLSTLL